MGPHGKKGHPLRSFLVLCSVHSRRVLGRNLVQFAAKRLSFARFRDCPHRGLLPTDQARHADVLADHCGRHLPAVSLPPSAANPDIESTDGAPLEPPAAWLALHGLSLNNCTCGLLASRLPSRAFLSGLGVRRPSPIPIQVPLGHWEQIEHSLLE